MPIPNYPKLTNELPGESGSGNPMAIEIDPGKDVELLMVTCHLSANGGASAGDFKVQIDDKDDPAFDVTLYKKDMDSYADAVYMPSRPIPIPMGSKVKITFPNANGVDWGVRYWTRDYKGPYHG